MNIVKKGLFATALAATTLVSTTPAMARDHYRGGDNDAAVAIGAGLVGLAIGALVIGNNNRDRYDNRYYVRDGWYYNDGYYYNRQGNRYSRHDWEGRYGRDGWRNDDRRDWRGDRRDGRWDRGDRYDYGRDRDYYERRGY